MTGASAQKAHRVKTYCLLLISSALLSLTSPSINVLSMSNISFELEMNLVEVIETVISSLDEFHNALVLREDDGYLWKFKYGSAEVWVQLTGNAEDDTLSVWSPVLKLPVQDPQKLFEKLMALNWLETLEAHFATFNHQVVVVSSRSVAGWSVEEISHLITLVATLADDYDDQLQQEFQGG